MVAALVADDVIELVADGGGVGDGGKGSGEGRVEDGVGITHAYKWITRV